MNAARELSKSSTQAQAPTQRHSVGQMAAAALGVGQGPPGQGDDAEVVRDSTVPGPVQALLDSMGLRNASKTTYASADTHLRDLPDLKRCAVVAIHPGDYTRMAQCERAIDLEELHCEDTQVHFVNPLFYRGCFPVHAATDKPEVRGWGYCHATKLQH